MCVCVYIRKKKKYRNRTIDDQFAQKNTKYTHKRKKTLSIKKENKART